MIQSLRGGAGTQICHTEYDFSCSVGKRTVFDSIGLIEQPLHPASNSVQKADNMSQLLSKFQKRLEKFSNDRLNQIYREIITV